MGGVDMAKVLILLLAVFLTTLIASEYCGVPMKTNEVRIFRNEFPDHSVRVISSKYIEETTGYDRNKNITVRNLTAFLENSDTKRITFEIAMTASEVTGTIRSELDKKTGKRFSQYFRADGSLLYTEEQSSSTANSIWKKPNGEVFLIRGPKGDIVKGRELTSSEENRFTRKLDREKPDFIQRQ